MHVTCGADVAGQQARPRIRRVKLAPLGRPVISAELLPRDAELVRAGREQLRPLLERASATNEAKFAVTLVSGEALQNAWIYGDRASQVVRSHCSVRPGQAVMIYRYLTDDFRDRTAPDETELLPAGRGIQLIRGFTEEAGGKAEWRFRQLSGRQSRSGKRLYDLTLVLVVVWH